MATIGSLNIDFNTNTAQLISDMRKASNSVHSASGRMEKSLKSASRGFKLLLGSVATLASVNGIAAVEDKFAKAEARVKLYTKSQEEFNAVQRELINISRRTNMEFGAGLDIYARLAASSQKLGTSNAELLKITETLNNTFRISGATMQEAKNSAIQFAQGIASGELRGEELRSVMEQNTRLTKILADEMSKGDIGLLREMAKEGKLTADRVLPAILKNYEKINEQAAKLPTTMKDAGMIIKESFQIGLFQGMNNQTSKFAELMKDPSLLQAIEDIGYGVGKISEFLAHAVRGARIYYESIAKTLVLVNETIAKVTGLKRVTSAKSMESGLAQEVILLDEQIDRMKALGKFAKDKEAHERKLNALILQRQKLYADIGRNEQTSTSTTNFGTIEGFSPALTKVGELNGELSETDKITKKVEDSLTKIKSPIDEMTDALDRNIRTWDDLEDAALDALQNIFKSYLSSSDVQSGLSNTINSVIGTAGSSLSDVASGIGSIFGFGGGRSGGGPMKAGKSYIVGEDGPERVFMGSDGYAMPSHKSGLGGTEVNVIVNNNTSAKASVTEQPNGRGGRDFIVTLDETVAGLVTNPYSRTSTALSKSKNVGHRLTGR